MNVAVRSLTADLPRRRFSATDVAGMVQAGIMAEDERVELIDGELVQMAAKGRGHDLPKSALLRLLVSASGADLVVGVENTLQLADEVLVEPDLVVFPRAAVLPDSPFIKVRGEDLLLVIEIALSSLSYDLGAKAALYARHGIREYWVIDPEHRRAWIHTRPRSEAWENVEELAGDAVLTLQVPELASFHVALGQIG